MEKRKLIEMGTLSRGRSQHRPRNDSKLYGGKYPFIQTGDVKNSNLYIEKYSQTYNDFGLNQSKLWPENTLCITIAANIADTGILSFPACFPDSIIGFTATKGKTDVRYVKYCFDLLQKSIQNMSKGSTQDNLSMEKLEQLEFNCPSFENQQKIAAVLSSLDDKIALNNRINAKLEQMAKRLYDYWFVQFDFPNADGKPYKSNGGKMVWNEELKREIPEGWEVGNLYDIAEYVNGLACQNYRPKESEKSLPVIKIREMNEGITADTEKVSASIPGKYRIYAGDILFSWSASLEIKIWTGETGGLNQHIFKVIPKGYFSKGYVYQQLSAYLVNFQKMAESRKTTMGHITSDHIKQSRILIPLKEIISAFNEKTFSIFNYQLSIEKETQKLTALRDRLLPLLMNGQVVVE